MLVKRIPLFMALFSMGSYATYKMPPDRYPFAFAASAIALVSGSFGVLRESAKKSATF